MTSPAVGYFAGRDGITVGSVVGSGDVLGHVDVLGVRQEIVAPISGVIGLFDVEPGQAIEYGQTIARVDPVSAASRDGGETGETPEPVVEQLVEA